MTIEQCCDTLFKTMETLAILQWVLFGIYGLMAIGSLNRIEAKLDKLLKDKGDNNGKRS